MTGGAIGRAPTGAAAASRADPEFLVKLLAVALGAAGLLHQAALGDWRFDLPHALVVGPAVVAVLRPGMATLLPALAGDFGAAILDYPTAVNHFVILAVGAAGVIVWAARRLSRSPGGRPVLPTASAFWQEAVPYLRVVLLLAYAVAAFAKLNEGFFDPATSCATKIWDDVVDYAPVLPRLRGHGGALVVATIAAEFGLPMLLAMRRTRLMGVAAGILFHALLALGGHAPFAAYAIALYVLFLPEDTGASVHRLATRLPSAARIFRAVARAAATTPAIVGSIAVVTLLTARHRPNGLHRYGPAVGGSLVTPVLVVLAGLALAGTIALWRSSAVPISCRYGTSTLRLPSPGWWLGIATLVAIAALPYLGLATRPTFTMYSNLRTESGRWNHVVVPSGVRIFDLADDLVTVLRAETPRLAAYAARQEQVAWIEFVALRQRHPDGAVVYERGGRVVALRDGERTDGPAALGKFLSFRSVPRTDSCQH